jgi:hypothetical protein
VDNFAFAIRASKQNSSLNCLLGVLFGENIIFENKQVKSDNKINEMSFIIKRVKDFDQVYTDNIVFRLHYKATVNLFVAASLVLTINQLIGDPIDYIAEGDIPHGKISNMCYLIVYSILGSVSLPKETDNDCKTC